MVGTVLAVFALAGSGCASAPSRPWCSNLPDIMGADCSYETFQQCMRTVSGLSGGNCTENPRWQGDRARPR
jgi:hypothetical protein